MVTVMDSQHPNAGDQMLKQLITMCFRQNPRKRHLEVKVLSNYLWSYMKHDIRGCVATK